MNVEVGKEYIFNTTDFYLEKYNGTKVKIIREKPSHLLLDKDWGGWYIGKFSDGYESEIFKDELSE